MSTSKPTYYDILGVRPSATYAELEIAHEHVLQENNVAGLPSFKRALALKKLRDANEAWDVLRVWDKRVRYHLETGIWLEGWQRQKMGYWGTRGDASGARKRAEGSQRGGAFEQWAESAGKRFESMRGKQGNVGTSTSERVFGSAFGGPRETSDQRSRSSGEGDKNNNTSGDETGDETDDEKPTYPEGASRYATSPSGTEIHILISTWRLSLFLSPKFTFRNDVTELSSPTSPSSISFCLGLAHNSAVLTSGGVNEITVKVEKLPSVAAQQGKRGRTRWDVTRLQAMFKEITPGGPSLTISLTAAPLALTEISPNLPWEFGFDFNMSNVIRAQHRATCSIFRREGFSDFHEGYAGKGTAEFELKNEDGLKADGVEYKGEEKIVRVSYGRIRMWRMVAVGWRR